MDPDSADAALAALERYLAAFNARDVAAFEGAFNLPAVRVAAGRIDIVEPGSHDPGYFSSGPLATWDHSCADRTTVIHAGADAAHIATRITRWGTDGRRIGRYDVVYYLTREAGRWGVKAHSGVAVSDAA